MSRASVRVPPLARLVVRCGSAGDGATDRMRPQVFASWSHTARSVSVSSAAAVACVLSAGVGLFMLSLDYSC